MRLTRKSSSGGGRWLDKDYCLDMSAVCRKFKYCNNCPIAKLLDRLCEYEETGFEPSDIAKMNRIAILNAADLIDKLENITEVL